MKENLQYSLFLKAAAIVPAVTERMCQHIGRELGDWEFGVLTSMWILL